MKHLTLEGEIVFEIFTKVENKKEIKCCKRLQGEDIIKTSILENYEKPIETEVDNKKIFEAYLYYYKRKDVYNKLKEINFKFE
jgi:hypothetical protein